MNGSQLRTPLSNQMYMRLEGLIESVEEGCYKEGKMLAEMAKDSSNCSKNLRLDENKTIKLMQRAFELFYNYDILTPEKILPKMTNLQNFLKEQQAMIDEMVYYHQKQLDIQKSVMDARQLVIEFKNKRLYGSLIAQLS